MLPHEKALVERLKDKPFALLGVNSDDPTRVKGKPYDRAAALARGDRFHAARKLAGNGLVTAGEEEAKFIAEAAAALKPRLDEAGLAWRHAVDGSTSGPWASRWNTRYWPHIFLIDAGGKIRHVDPDEEKLDQLLDELIAEAQGTKKEGGK